MEVSPFEERFSAAVAMWPATAEEAVMWCSSKEFPVAAQTVAAWGRAPDVHPFVALRAGDPVAYGEVCCDEEEQEAELARIIVAPAGSSAR